ncbi:hypothetical protein D3C71_1789490 [compost metagenome]
MLQINTGLLKPIQALAELLTLRGREFQRNRQQQLLRSLRGTPEFLIVIFVVNPFMSGMLVDQIQPVIILGNDICSVMLADIAQLRERRQRGRSLCRWRIQIPSRLGRQDVPACGGGTRSPVTGAE